MFNPGSSLVDIGVAITLQNRFSTQADIISKDFRQLMSEVNTYKQAINSSSGTLTSAALSVVGGMADAYKYSAGVQNEVWMASKIAGATNNQQRELLQLAKDVNEITPLTSADIASAERFLAMAGNKAEAVKAMIPTIAKLGTILGTPVGGKGGVADLMTNIMSTFSIPMNRVKQVGDDIYTAVTNANMSLPDLAESIKYAAGDAANAGISLREMAAAIGVMGNSGMQGSMAGVALGNMIRYLSLSASEARKKGYMGLRALGLDQKDFFDAQGRLKDLQTIFQTLNKAFEGVTDKDKIKLWNEIFQVRGSRAAATMLRDMANSNAYARIMGTYDKNSGIVDTTISEFNETPEGRLSMLESSIGNFKVSLGEVLTVFTPLVQGLTKIVDTVQDFIQTPVGKKTVEFLGIVSALGLVVNGIKMVVMNVKMISLGFKTAAGGTTSLKVGVTSVNAALTSTEVKLSNITRLMGILVGLNSGLIAKMGISPATGALYVQRKGKNGKSIMSGLDNTLSALILGKAMTGTTSTAGATAATKAATAVGKGAAVAATTKAATKLGGSLLGKITGIGAMLGRFLPGWGWGIAAIVTFMPEIINLLSSISGNTAVNRDLSVTRDMRNYVVLDPFKTNYNPYFIPNHNRDEVVVAAAKAMTDRVTRVALTINGRDVGTITDGSTYDLNQIGILY